MIEESYVSFQTAKLLKEKGFDGRTIWIYELPHGRRTLVYSERPAHCVISNCFNSDEGYEDYCIAAPTQDLVLKWLRDVHHIHFEVDFLIIGDHVPYKIKIYPIYKQREDITFDGDTYEEAIEKAITYCLTNII